MQKIYNRYQWIAVFCVTLFILSGAGVLLAANKKICRRYVAKQETTNLGVSGFEAGLIYEQLQAELRDLSEKTFEVSGYELSGEEITLLTGLKKRYRLMAVLCVISLPVGLVCQLKLARRRQFAPLVLGPAFAALVTALTSLWMLVSKGEFPKAFRQMLFKADFSCFGGGIISGILPAELAGKLLLTYILHVLLLSGVALFGRFLIYFYGRPHRF